MGIDDLGIALERKSRELEQSIRAHLIIVGCILLAILGAVLIVSKLISDRWRSVQP